MSSLPCADRMGRAITYLRVSVTDRCNLRCVYCMPAEGLPLQEHADILRYEEIARLVSIAAELGIRRVRLTGGEPLARRSLEQGWNVRFIEVMPLGEGAHWSGDGYVPIDEVRQAIEQALGSLEPAELAGNGPARYYRWAHAPDAGTIGFISPISDHFCAYCNRLRLTADGKLLPCLFGKQELDLRAALRQGADDAALRDLFREAIAAKPRGHDAPDHVAPGERLMSRTGG